MKEVYCYNCKHSKRIKFRDRDGVFYYCPLQVILEDADNMNLNCKLYKRKWWKFWIK